MWTTSYIDRAKVNSQTQILIKNLPQKITYSHGKNRKDVNEIQKKLYLMEFKTVISHKTWIDMDYEEIPRIKKH